MVYVLLLFRLRYLLFETAIQHGHAVIRRTLYFTASGNVRLDKNAPKHERQETQQKPYQQLSAK